MPPVRTARRTPMLSSPYETPVLQIVVGDEEAVFSVNEGLLQSTSFLTKEKRLTRNRDGGPPYKPSEADTRESAGPVKAEESMFCDSSERTIDSDEETAAIDLTNDDVDFMLKGKFYYTRDAFVIFVRSLNDAAPLKPTTGEDCRALFRAYALAQEYGYAKLENQVIGTFQGFYSENRIPVTDLLYLIKHWGDRIGCLLAGYLTAQVAYEMTLDWKVYQADNSESSEFERLFGGEASAIVEQLIENIANYADPKKSQDPARDKKLWRMILSE